MKRVAGSRGTCLVAGLLVTATVWAQAGPGIPEKARLEIAADRTAYEPGETVRIVVAMEVEDGWHVNANPASYDYLIPTTVELELPQGWPPVRVEYPAGELQRFAFADEPISVYDGRVALTAHTAVPRDAEPGVMTAESTITYQACDDRRCLPPITRTLPVEVVVGSGGEPTGALAAAGDGAAPTGPGAAAPLALILLLGGIGGLILNVMPCVLPVLSLKLLGMVQGAGQSRRQVVAGALATTAGILASFLGLAAAAILVRAAGGAVGWGVQFQQPIFVAVLAVVVTLFCLNLWGLFEIPLPRRLAATADLAPSKGLAGHFGSGLFATLMATPCSAPFLGTAVGFGLAQPPATVLAVFLAVGTGFALPYLALAAFPGAVRLLPRPGAWMDRLRKTMGFLLAAALVWLLYVLDNQVSSARLAFIELSLLGLALAVWLRNQGIGAWWRRLGGTAVIVAAAFVVGLAVSAPEATTAAAERPRRELIDWQPFDRQRAEHLAADEGRLVFVDVTADWCFTCKVNERLILETQPVAEAFERHEVIAMKADWTNRDDAIARFLADHGRYGIPFYLLYRPDRPPHLFSELITRDAILEALEDSARPTRLAAGNGQPAAAP